MAGRSKARKDEVSSSAALRILETHTVLTLATLYDNDPHAVSLMYANDGFTLYWLSDPRSRHSRGLAVSPRASVTVADHFSDFLTIEGLQIRGIAYKVDDKDDAASGFRMLAQRYAFLQEFLSGPARLVRSLDMASVYRLDPVEVTLIDNTKGFGHKETVPLAGSG